MRPARRRLALGIAGALLFGWMVNPFSGSDGVSQALAQAADRAAAAGAPRIGVSDGRLVYGNAEIDVPDGWKIETDATKEPYVGYMLYPAEFEHFYDSPVLLTITPGLRDAPDKLEPFIDAVLDDRELKADLISSSDYEAWRAGDDSILSKNNVEMSRERSGAIGDDPDRGALISSNINVVYNKRHIYIAQVGQGVGALIDFYVAKPEEMQPYFPVFQNIISSFRFNPEAVTEVGAQDRIIALYQGRGGYYLLYDNGRFASTPDGGYELPASCNPEVCGHFVPHRASMSLIFDDGKTTDARVTRDSLAIDGAEHRFAQPLAAGTSLSGLYRLTSATSFSGAFGSGSVFTDNKFTFDSSGNFQSQEKGGVGIGLIGQTSFGPRNAGGGTSRDDGTNEGRYSIEGYFLVLHGTDGSTSRRFIYRAVDKEGRSTIAIDGRTYEQQ